MNFKEHSELKDRHAFLGASSYAWLNYSEDKLDAAFFNYLARERGTRLHAFAAEAIALGIKLPKVKRTLNLYVNDAIGFRMKTEQPLYFSENCFGTADAISFRKNFLRIHDLKTGVTKASMNQLEIYEALFCLEYSVDPLKISSELRIYQNDEVLVHKPEAGSIKEIMTKIILFDKRIDRIKAGDIL